jgi:uncharacterized protein YprB with RNaseH-like and TPR domain
MSSLTKTEIKSFLLQKRGYLKKSPLNVARAIWKTSQKHNVSKTKTELAKELEQIKEIQSTLRLAQVVIDTEEEKQIVDIYDKILEEKNRPKKRLFFDIETSANIVFSWRIGREVTLSHDDLIKERAIICVCWKWEGEEKLYSLQWNKGCDRDLLKKFSKIIDSADEVIGQNSDRFDIKWLRARAIYHDIQISPKLNSIDTLKMAKSGFYFNSNKLDYMGHYLGVGKKIKTEYDLWKDIMLHNDKKAMNKMVDYCKEDVALLERVYTKLQKFSPVKKFKYKIK